MIDGLVRPSPPVAVKIVVAGQLGVGKTTFVSSVSEIRPLRTEGAVRAGTDPRPRTAPGEGTGGRDGWPRPAESTTLVMDFGRITLRSDLVLYLFGTPGQARFSFVWDELSSGAIGAIVLADTRRLDDCFRSVDYFEERGIQFIVAVNGFAGHRLYRPEQVKLALNLDPDVPVLGCDARDRASCRHVLTTLVEHVRAGVATG